MELMKAITEMKQERGLGPGREESYINDQVLLNRLRRFPE